MLQAEEALAKYGHLLSALDRKQRGWRTIRQTIPEPISSRQSKKLAEVLRSAPTPEAVDVEDVAEEAPDADVDIEDIIEARMRASKRKAAKFRVHRRHLQLPAEPVGFWVVGDPHVDNEGCDWERLYDDVELVREHQEAHGGLLGVCVGDVQDNWIGRLQRLYANSSCLASDGWRLSTWLLERIQWLAVVGGNHDCHDDQTEVLTERGWLKFPDVLPSDKVLGLDADGRSEWQEIIKQVEYNYDGPLVSVENAQVSALVTPNHRVLHQKRGSGKQWSGLRYAFPGDIRGRVRIPLAGLPQITGDVLLCDALVELAAWILTDGHVERYEGGVRRFTLYQRESNAGTVRDVLRRAGVEFTESRRQRDVTAICGVELKSTPEAEVSFRVGAGEARRVLSMLDMVSPGLPAWVYKMSTPQFDIFIDAAMDADGSWAKSGRSGALYGRREILDQFQALCVLNSCSATLVEYRDGHYRLNVCRERAYSQMDWAPGLIPYAGKVYCLTVPLSNFCVRRSGRVHFSGNSWANGPGFDPLARVCEDAGVECYAPDEIRMDISWKGRPDLEHLDWVLRHDAPGRSWFHATHGPNKLAMLDGKVHLVTAGHTHEWGLLATEQTHGRCTTALRVRGYKRSDEYALAGGFTEQQFGESCLIVVQPEVEGPGRVTVFWDLEQGLRLLRCVREG